MATIKIKIKNKTPQKKTREVFLTSKVGEGATYNFNFQLKDRNEAKSALNIFTLLHCWSTRK